MDEFVGKLVGSKFGDNVGSGREDALSGGCIVWSPCWDCGSAVDAGAVSVSSGLACTAGIRGLISMANSETDTAASGGINLNFGLNRLRYHSLPGTSH
jgi:hypothetical protein